MQTYIFKPELGTVKGTKGILLKITLNVSQIISGTRKIPFCYSRGQIFLSE